MRKTLVCIVTIAVLAACETSHGGGKKDPGAAVLKKIQGTWKFTSQEMDGKPVPAEALAGMTIVFSGDKWSVRQDGKEIQAGTHKFDPAKKPGHVDAVVTAGQDEGNTMLGIFELKGDTMKVCFDPKGKARPTDFKTEAGQFAAVVQRVAKKD
jgi:uncharacterized protein (TIGR03067 family)